MVEQLTVNQLVAGSNPVSGAKKKHQMILVFFLALETGSNQAFCDNKKWFGVAKFARRNIFREQTSGEGRSPLSSLLSQQ